MDTRLSIEIICKCDNCNAELEAHSTENSFGAVQLVISPCLTCYQPYTPEEDAE